MAKTVVQGGKAEVEAAIDTIIAGGTPNIQWVFMPEKGYYIIIHVA
jgi:hypothetical protein